MDSLTRLLSMKGAGTVVAAGLFGEASDLLVGGSFQQTRAYLGAAPVKKVREDSAGRPRMMSATRPADTTTPAS